VAGASLLTLIDDIAAVLDDVAILSKVAAKKTAGVLGDDLALNAEQVSGVKADRELPVVWAVAKGSFLNKLILVPSALLISAFAPPLITILLVIGGLFLCFEGFEKVFHQLLHSKQMITEEREKTLNAIKDESLDIVALEKEKIKGAVRTDFILSAEIVVIVLGSVKEAAFETQVMVVSALAIAITVGVYGLVAAIVKLDDLGLYLLRKSVSGNFNGLQRATGRGLLIFAPFLMKLLTIVGTVAMFLVGGGIIVHSFSWLSDRFHQLEHWASNYVGGMSDSVLPILLDGLTGIVAGGVVLMIISIILRVKNKLANH
jgi:predicted DNA repair protein MutK